MRILIVGYNAFDVLLPADVAAKSDSKNEVAEIVFSGGGPAANAAVTLKKLGADVKLVTCLAQDMPGKMQEAELLAAGVDLSLSPRLPAGIESPKAVILVNQKDQTRTIYWSRGNVPSLQPSDVDARWLDDIDLLYTDGHENQAVLPLALRAHQKGIPVVLDAGSVRPGSQELMTVCSDVIASTKFAAEFTGETDTHKALSQIKALGPSRVAQTFGKDGSIALCANKLIHVPAFEVPTIDTTGCGDVFHAGYAYALVKGEKFLECLKFGSAVAALKCRGWGGRQQLPDEVEVRQFIDTGKRLAQKVF